MHCKMGDITLITYESICKKLGFDLVKDLDDQYKKIEGREFECDDSHPSPFAVLTVEEILWIQKEGYLN